MIGSIRRLSSAAVPLHLERIGEGGEPLVILHGLFGHIQNWRSVGRALSARLGRRVILADMRNHGSSPRSSRMDYNVMAEDITELAAKEGDGGPVNLLGHSMGGKAAIAAAIKSPHSFSRLIIEDVAPRVYTGNASLFRSIINGVASLDLSQPRSELSKLLSASIPDKAIRDFILTNVVNVDGEQTWKVNVDVIAKSLDNILGMELPEGEFTRPALFLHGGNSGYVRESDRPTIFKHFPSARIESIPGAGHWVHAEKPTEFIASVTRFLME